MEMDQHNPGSSAKMLFFNSFFFKKLTEKANDEQSGSRNEQNHERVRRWTKVGASSESISHRPALPNSSNTAPFTAFTDPISTLSSAV